jgi:23S rRNA G2445 N2-methylase RlmL
MARQFTNQDIAAFDPPHAPSLVITNPPWGLRISGSDDVEWPEDREERQAQVWIYGHIPWIYSYVPLFTHDGARTFWYLAM